MSKGTREWEMSLSLQELNNGNETDFPPTPKKRKIYTDEEKTCKK